RIKRMVFEFLCIPVKFAEQSMFQSICLIFFQHFYVLDTKTYFFFANLLLCALN
uniref:Uncharacterized protein n=1 Tax=Oryza brachyantha TaxID=4533 RepID=J3N2C4_ORYBR